MNARSLRKVVYIQWTLISVKCDLLHPIMCHLIYMNQWGEWNKKERVTISWRRFHERQLSTSPCSTYLNCGSTCSEMLGPWVHQTRGSPWSKQLPTWLWCHPAHGEGQNLGFEVANNLIIKCTTTGKILFSILDNNETRPEVVFSIMIYVPGLSYWLFLVVKFRFHGQYTMVWGNATILFFGESEVPLSLTTFLGKDGGHDEAYIQLLSLTLGEVDDQGMVQWHEMKNIFLWCAMADNSSLINLTHRISMLSVLW